MHNVISFLSPSYELTYKKNKGLQFGPYSFKFLSNPLSKFLSKSLKDGVNIDHIYQSIADPTDLATAIYFLDFCKKENLLHETWELENEKILTYYLPQSDSVEYQIDLNKHLKISRFTCLNWEDGQCYLHSALSLARLTIHSSKIMTLLFWLTTGVEYKYLIENANLPEKTCADFILLLSRMKVLNVEEDIVLKQWEAHDLLFHTRTRCSSLLWKAGATFRFKGTDIESQPAVKAIQSDKIISLYRPDIDTLSKHDMTLTQALETRQSIREYTKVITLKDLGEFLYRAARIKSVANNSDYEFILTNYPSGGAVHETEINLIVNQCEGLEKGAYHYDREKHTLSYTNEITQEAETLIASAKFATRKKDDVQVLVLLSSRFQRLAWKYENMAYTLMLKHIGVIMQTFYLVATAMGLSPSSIGCGDAKLSSKVLKTNFYEESSLGEFLLGG